uniref:C3H1-type domain-containing protein n=1 Tax=Astyanax mexicanus TaxID=7994 RepID=A0A8B9KCT4_ASTMX
KVAKPDICKFFLRGRCHFGERCRLSHRWAPGSPAPEKKPRMRTADDVISRILWDSSVDPTDFVVGHLDRFLGVLERPFADFSWDTQMTIPQHRIMYFSYKGQHVWDRDSRTDRVFGSTGQTVLPPFDREDQSQGEVWFVHDPEDNADCAANGLKDEESADASLTRRAEGLSLSPKNKQIAPEEDGKDICAEEDHETPPVPSVLQEPRPGRQPRKPTHFICFRVDSPAALLAFQRVQRKILTHLPQSEEFWVNPSTLHVTLSLLVLQGPAEVQAAAEILRSVVGSIYKPPITVFFPPKLKHFNGRVLFIPPRPIPDIQSLNTPLQEAYKEKGWLHRHSKCPNYHVTLAKVEPKAEGEEAEKMFEDVGVIKLAKDINFGKLEVNKLYLCVNGSTKTESGFYQVVCAVPLPTV